VILSRDLALKDERSLLLKIKWIRLKQGNDQRIDSRLVNLISSDSHIIAASLSYALNTIITSAIPKLSW